MNTLKSLSFTAILVSGICYYAIAQDVSDALRYSYLQPQGTARSMGFGNAVGSVGGDFSDLSINPAGIGVYRSSEFTATPSLQINGVDGKYLGNTQSSDNTRFTFSNLGLVFTHAKKGRRYERSKWKTVSFGVGFNRLADFNRDYSYSGNNYTSSATQLYATDANVNNDAESPGTLGYNGYQSFLVNYDSVSGGYKSIVDPTKGVNQMRTVSERGGLNEVAFSLGGNYMEKLLLGFTIGVPILNYNRIAYYSETPVTAGTSDLNNYALGENLTTNGLGINLKLGAIYKFSDYFRIGLAVHTPTYYSMHDEYTTAISSDVNNIGLTDVPANHNVFDYGMTTPWRGVLSATGLLGKYGFISADYELVDYSTTRFYYGGDYLDEQTEVNNEIKSTLKTASNLRIGVEGRVTNFFSLRLGFNYYGNPYKNDNGINGDALAFSGGFGFRFNHWFIDAAYRHIQYNGQEQPYTTFSTVAVPVATIQNGLNTAALTLGFKF